MLRAVVTHGVEMVGGCDGGRRGLSTGWAMLSHSATRKMLLQERVSKKKRRHSYTEILQNPSNLTKVSQGPRYLTPRLMALSKVYLDKIADILSTGEVASELQGLGLELSQVKVMPSLQGINVYWICSGTEADDRIEAILHQNVSAIRHELSQQRIIGHSPPITFVRDHRYHKVQEVERLLAVADYGEEFVPSDSTHHLKASIATSSLTTTLDYTLKAAIEDLEAQSKEQEETDPFEEALKLSVALEAQQEDSSDVALPSDLPAMRHDVLGVNTHKVYRMIQQGITRARADHRKQRGASSQWSLADPSGQIPQATSSSQEIQRWANHYQQLRKKEKRKQNKDAALLTVPQDYQGDGMEEEEHMKDMDYMEDLD